MSSHYVIAEEGDRIFLQPVPQGHPGSVEMHSPEQVAAVEYELQGLGHRSECPVPNNPYRPVAGPNPWILLGEALVLNQKLVEAEMDSEKRKEYGAVQRRLTDGYFWVE